jgi:hypothetical protein
MSNRIPYVETELDRRHLPRALARDSLSSGR